MLECRTEFMGKPAMCNDHDADHVAPQNWSARLKAALFVATGVRRKPEPMPVDEAIVTPPKEAPISASAPRKARKVQVLQLEAQPLRG